jgi:SAM-dependent methyltransferase
LAELYRELSTGPYDAENAGRERTAAKHVTIIRRFRKRGRLLDVGCASGIFLSAAANAGWNVVGVEPSEALCDAARARLAGRGEIIQAPLEQVGLQPSSFDVITLWDVLEHVTDPVAFLERCCSLLAPGGILIANVPRLDSLQARVFGRRWPLLLPEHLSYFTYASLRLCGERAGLTWVGKGERAAFFSVSYILRRMAQHGIPGVTTAGRLADWTGFSKALIPIRMGELFGIWTR